MPDPAIGPPSDSRPLHLIDPGADKTRCGLKWNDKASLPHCGTQWVERFRRHHATVCPDCDTTVEVTADAE